MRRNIGFLSRRTIVPIMTIILSPTFGMALLPSYDYRAWADGAMRTSTYGESVDILLEPNWSVIYTPPGETPRNLYVFDVSFLKSGTEIIQPDVDFSFAIKCDTCNVGASDPSLTVIRYPPEGQPLIHSGQYGEHCIECLGGGTGKEHFAYDLDKYGKMGDLTIVITVAGIDNKTIDPETGTFHVNITPEFPVAATLAMSATVIGALIIISRKSNQLFNI